MAETSMHSTLYRVVRRDAVGSLVDVTPAVGPGMNIDELAAFMDALPDDIFETQEYQIVEADSDFDPTKPKEEPKEDKPE